MTFTLKHDQFDDEAGAVALAEAAGLTPRAFDFGEVHNEFHWHDFSSVVCVVDGSLTITVRDSGEQCTLRPGSCISAEAGVVHREDSAGYRAVVGFDRDPATIEPPIDRDPALLPS